MRTGQIIWPTCEVLSNRATQGLYPPGSTVKPIVYWAAAQVVDDETSWSDPGVLNLPGGMISNAGGRAHGQISIAEALAYSSNVVFAELAVDLEEQLLKCFRLFGLGQQIDFERQPEVCARRHSFPYHAAQLGIGQGELWSPHCRWPKRRGMANGGSSCAYLVRSPWRAAPEADHQAPGGAGAAP